MLVKLTDVGFEWYGRVLFKGFTEVINPGDRVGLLGRNGSGKTTLLRLIHGSLEPTEGEIERAGHLRIGFHEQIQSSERELSVWEAVRKDLTGEDADRTTRSLLKGVGFDEAGWNRPLCSLSGGESGKLNLAKLLSREWDLLLLDEPTNHLDIANIEWLTEHLTRFYGSFIVVSHDRYFLKSVCNAFWEISAGRVWSFKGDYMKYLKARELLKKSNMRRAENLRKEIERQKRIIEMYRRWNRENFLKQARSREKMVTRLEKELSEIEIPESEPVVPMSLPEVERADFKVLAVEDFGVELGGKYILQKVNLEINRNQKVAILGRNGAGKTTFIKAITGLIPFTGKVEWGTKVKYSLVDQMLENLAPDLTILEQAWSKARDWPDWKIRAYLGRFGFTGNEVKKVTDELSGGEKTRPALALAILENPNVLVLDEPTNHMDLESVQVLEEVLKDYRGTILMVTHDKSLIESVCERILVVFNGSVIEIGDIEEYLKLSSKVSDSSEEDTKDAKEKLMAFQRSKKLKNRVKSLKKRLGELEEEYLKKEGELARLEGKMKVHAADHEMLLTLHREHEKLTQKMEQILEEMDELSVKLKELGSTTSIWRS